MDSPVRLSVIVMLSATCEALQFRCLRSLRSYGRVAPRWGDTAPPGAHGAPGAARPRPQVAGGDAGKASWYTVPVVSACAGRRGHLHRRGGRWTRGPRRTATVGRVSRAVQEAECACVTGLGDRGAGRLVGQGEGPCARVGSADAPWLASTAVTPQSGGRAEHRRVWRGAPGGIGSAGGVRRTVCRHDVVRGRTGGGGGELVDQGGHAARPATAGGRSPRPTAGAGRGPSRGQGARARSR